MSEHRMTVRHLVDPPRPVWVSLWKNSWEECVEFPGLILEWEGVGGVGVPRRWKARVEIDPAVGPPPSWNPRYPWMPADKLRPR